MTTLAWYVRAVLVLAFFCFGNGLAVFGHIDSDGLKWSSVQALEARVATSDVFGTSCRTGDRLPQHDGDTASWLPNLSDQQEMLAQETQIQPTLPGTNIRDYMRPGYRIERR